MKRNKSSKIMDRQISGEDKEVYKAIKILIGVLVFFLLIYLIAAIITGEIEVGGKKKKVTEIQYSEILAEMTFKQSDKEYFVIFYDFDQKSTELINAIVNDLGQNNSVYKVDLSKKFNANYLGEETTNKKPNDISQLKVKNPTLLKISAGKVSKYIEGLDNIKSYSLKLK